MNHLSSKTRLSFEKKALEKARAGKDMVWDCFHYIYIL